MGASVFDMPLGQVVAQTNEAIAEAGDIERRLFLFALRRWAGADRGAPDVLAMPNADVVSEVNRLVGDASDYLRRLALYALQRWVVLGQREYGLLSLGTKRAWSADALEEQSDRALYRVMHAFDNRDSRDLQMRAVDAVQDMADDFEAVAS